VDAVAIGSETLLTDDPRLDVRDLFRERPLVRAVFDRRLRTPPSARLLSTLDAGPVVVLTSVAAVERRPAALAALEAEGALVFAEEVPSVIHLLRRLIALDVQCVLLEGGPTLHRSAWLEGVVDVVQAYVASTCLGEAGVPAAEELLRALPALAHARVATCGQDALIEGYVHRID
jgi:diaminohydroxyphosphoribosylaminopyrimidine deaminase/5-amino-6-(5-phosphoribosylamino)uracil reductase